MRVLTDPPLKSNDGRLRLIPWHAADLDALAAVLDASFTDPVLGWPLYRCATVIELVDLLTSAHLHSAAVFWSVEVETAPVGLVGAMRYEGERNTLACATYLDPSVRRTGLNAAIKDVVARGAADACVPLVASVALNNDRSNAAMRRVLGPEAVITEVLEPWRSPAHRANLYRFPTSFEAPSSTWPDVATRACGYASPASLIRCPQSREFAVQSTTQRGSVAGSGRRAS